MEELNINDKIYFNVYMPRGYINLDIVINNLQNNDNHKLPRVFFSNPNTLKFFKSCQKYSSGDFNSTDMTICLEYLQKTETIYNNVRYTIAISTPLRDKKYFERKIIYVDHRLEKLLRIKLL